MHLAYVALLAFLIAEVHYIRDSVPPPRRVIVQAGIAAPKILAPPAGPCLAAEEENRASALNDGVMRRGCTDEATGSRFPDPHRRSTKTWKPWSWGS